ncbi:MAG: regulatory protein RecX [Firmicutes bacterium]|nr:regulatory protein RecX [Bacillota bacterium]
MDASLAKKKAIRLLTARDRTVHELRTRLVADYDETVVDDVLAYLREMDFVNDERFARNYVDQRNRLRPTGNLGLRRELHAKGISSEIIDMVMNSPEEELELAKRLLESRAPSLMTLSREVRLRRAYGLLERRGFPWQTAQAAVEQVLDSDLPMD